MKLKGTITEQNLLKAFAGESQARNRYTFFAQTAKEEGYEQIAGIFAETADQELAHARRFFEFLDDGGMLLTCRISRRTSRENSKKTVGSSRRRLLRWV